MIQPTKRLFSSANDPTPAELEYRYDPLGRIPNMPQNTVFFDWQLVSLLGLCGFVVSVVLNGTNVVEEIQSKTKRKEGE